MQLWLFNLFRKPSRSKREKPAPARKPARRRSSALRCDQALQALWLKIRADFFPDHPEIDEYMVLWSSRRQKRTLASCNITRRRVAVARELNYAQHLAWLEPLLYHEMCHARLAGNKRAWHGREFKALERKHPRIKEMNAWIKQGGWLSAVRSDRAKRAYLLKQAVNQ